MNASSQTRRWGRQTASIAAAVVLAALLAAALGLAGCQNQQAASSSAASNQAQPAASASTSSDSETSAHYALLFNEYSYADAQYLPGDSLSLVASVVNEDPDEGISTVDATYEWTVEPALGATTNGPALEVASLPAAGTYRFSVKAIGADGQELISESHDIQVRDSRVLEMTIDLEEEGTQVDTCKAGKDYMRIMLPGLPWSTAYAENAKLSWQVKNVSTGEVYDESTGLTDLDPKRNGGIEAEEFGNYQWPAMMATFNKPGDFEITATFTSASGHQASVVKSLKVV